MHPTFGRTLVIAFACLCIGFAVGVYFGAGDTIATWCGR
jgi:hypothetical protein